MSENTPGTPYASIGRVRSEIAGSGRQFERSSHEIGYGKEGVEKIGEIAAVHARVALDALAQHALRMKELQAGVRDRIRTNGTKTAALGQRGIIAATEGTTNPQIMDIRSESAAYGAALEEAAREHIPSDLLDGLLTHIGHISGILDGITGISHAWSEEIEAVQRQGANLNDSCQNTDL